MKTHMEPQASAEELIQKAQGGDRQAFAALLERYRKRLERSVQRDMGQHLKQEAELEDVLQETSLRAFNSIGHFRYHNEESFPRWHDWRLPNVRASSTTGASPRR